MTRTVTALYDSYSEAEQALAHLAAGAELTDSAIVDGAGAAELDRVQLNDEQRAGCEQQLQQGGYLLVAQVASDESADTLVALLQEFAERPADAGAAQAGGAVAEEHIPLLEEELRVGTREVVKGGARVHAFVAEAPVQQEVELREEHATIERRPVERRLSDEELAQGGLLQERVIEISEMREEAIVSKEAYVREELVVKKSIERRVEQIEDTVRRTEVEVEELPAEERPAFSGFGSDGADGRQP